MVSYETLSEIVNENGTLFLHSKQEEIRAITSNTTNCFERNRCCLEFISLVLWSNPRRSRDSMNSWQIYFKTFKWARSGNRHIIIESKFSLLTLSFKSHLIKLVTVLDISAYSKKSCRSYENLIRV